MKKDFSRFYSHVSDLEACIAQAEKYARARGLKIDAPGPWLKSWLKRADTAASAQATFPAQPMDAETVRRMNDLRHDQERDAWLKAHGLERPPGLPGETYVQMLREEIRHMTTKWNGRKT